MKRFILQLLFTCCAIYMFPQQVMEPDTVIQRFLAQTRLYPQENLYLHTDKSDYVAGDTVWFRAYAVNAISRKQESCFSKRIRIYTGHKKQEKENKKPKGTYHVDFMPEGGQAIDGKPCRVAFRAQNGDGKGENIQGIVIDEQKDTLLRFNSRHNGMGYFEITLDKKKKYNVVCNNDSGQIKQFTLPQAVEGAALSILSDSVYCHVTLVHNHYFATDSLQLAILQRGYPCFAGWWNHDTMSFPLQAFDEGVAHFLLLSSTGSILSERLFFINRPQECKVDLSSNKTEFAPRQLVEITLGIKANENISFNGDCSISVTDSNDVPVDETVNIRSALLLTADLSGIIEEPGWYFKDTEPAKEKEGLDMLMLTHCSYHHQEWRRGI